MAILGKSKAESIERDVRGHFTRLVTGSLSLQEMQAWLIDHEAQIAEHASPQLYDDIERVEHIIAEYSGDHIDAAAAIEEIAKATGEQGQAVLHRSRIGTGRAS